MAEVVCGGLRPGAGAPGACLVTVEVAPELAVGEPDVEVQELLQRSAGRNLGLDYLPGALDFEAGADGVDPGPGGSGSVVRRPGGQRRPVVAQPGHALLARAVGADRPRRALTFHHHWPGAGAAVARPYDAAARALIECQPGRAGRRRRAGAAGDPAAALGGAGARARRLAVGRRTGGGPRERYVAQLLARLAARDAWLLGLITAAETGGSGPPPCARAGGTAVLAGSSAAGRGPPSDDQGNLQVRRVAGRPPRRGEALNAGVLVYCRQRDYLGSRVHLDVQRLYALDPTADAEAIGRALQAAADVCAADPAAGAAGREALGSGSAG